MRLLVPLKYVISSLVAGDLVLGGFFSLNLRKFSCLPFMASFSLVSTVSCVSYKTR